MGIAKLKPERTSEGYRCPVCKKFEHHHAMVVYQHMARDHAKTNFKATTVSKDKDKCCDNQRLVLLNRKEEVELKAIRMGYVAVCDDCGELQ